MFYMKNFNIKLFLPEAWSIAATKIAYGCYTKWQIAPLHLHTSSIAPHKLGALQLPKSHTAYACYTKWQIAPLHLHTRAGRQRSSSANELKSQLKLRVQDSESWLCLITAQPTCQAPPRPPIIGRFTIIRISSHALDPRSSWAIRICTSCGTTAVRWISIWLHRRWYTSSSTRSMCMASRSRERLSEKSISALRLWSCCCTCRYSRYSTPNTSAVIHPLYISNDLSAFCTLHLLLHSFTIGNLSSFPAPWSFSSFRKNTAVCSAILTNNHTASIIYTHRSEAMAIAMLSSTNQQQRRRNPDQ